MNSLVPWAKIARARTGTRKGMSIQSDGRRTRREEAGGEKEKRGRRRCGERTTCAAPAIYGLSDSGSRLNPSRSTDARHRRR